MSAKALQNQKYQTCIDACNDCFESCEFCATSDLHEQDVRSMARCIQLNRDCANICTTASQFMSRDSEYSKEICIICARLCGACADDAKNTLTWNTVNYVLKYVGDALKNAEKWLDTDIGSISYSFRSK